MSFVKYLNILDLNKVDHFMNKLKNTEKVKITQKIQEKPKYT